MRQQPDRARLYAVVTCHGDATCRLIPIAPDAIPQGVSASAAVDYIAATLCRADNAGSTLRSQTLRAARAASGDEIRGALLIHENALGDGKNERLDVMYCAVSTRKGSDADIRPVPAYETTVVVRRRGLCRWLNPVSPAALLSLVLS